MKDIGIEKLMEDLGGLEKPSIEFKHKDELKKNIMGRIKSPDVELLPFSVKSLPNLLKQSVAGIALNTMTKAKIKERVFEMIDNHSQKRFFFSNFFLFNKRLLSSVLLVAIFFGTFNFLNINTRVVRAATFTILKSYVGEVSVNRFGDFVELKPGMKLLESDVVYTGDDGRAVIEYFDNSVSRLASGTRVILEKLQRPNEYSIETNVEVEVVQGVVWSKVLNLVGDHSSFIVDAKDYSASARKAAFNVKVDEDGLEIGVFHHTVDVSDQDGIEHLLSGEKLLVKEGAVKVREVRNLDKNDKENDSWVKENLEFDRRYLSEVENRLLIAKAEAVGVDIDDDLSFDKSLRENALLFLTFDDVKFQKIELDLAEKNFIAAQVKLHNEKLTDEERAQADDAIKVFSNKVKDFYNLTDEIAATDKEYSTELKTYISEKINSHKKDLGVVMPNSPVYVAVKVVDELQLLQADDDSEMAEIKLGQAVDKLATAEGIADNGDWALASEVVDEYKEDVSSALKLIDDIDESDDKSKKNKERLTEKASRDLALLGSIKVLPDAGVVVAVPVVSATTAITTDVPAISAVPEELVVDVEEDIQPESLIEGPYGVTIKGDKILSPLLEDIN